MTTILVDTHEKVMYADSRVSGGGTCLTQKIFEAPDGTLIGFAGTLIDCIKFVNWYIAGADKSLPPPFGDSKDIQALTINEKGCFLWDGELTEYIVNDSFAAIGSGGDIGKTAIFLGWSPEEAYEIVFELDGSSGPPMIRRPYKKITVKKPRKTSKK